MRDFNASLFSLISGNLEILIRLPDAQDDLANDAMKSAGHKSLESFLDDCTAMGLTTSAMSIQKMMDAFSQDKCRINELRALATELQGRLIDEMRSRYFLSLTISEAWHYTRYWKGWEEVFVRFPCSNTMTDVEEARKCLALGRYTAAVFHLMRVTEVAVLELQCFLDTAPDPKAHFGSVLQKLEHLQQKTAFKDLPEHLKPYAGFLNAILPQLHAVKDSWRNKVSHVDDRIIIADVFTEEMALGIHDATLLLMKKLASGLPPLTA